MENVRLEVILSEDFLQACELFHCDPQEVLQCFVDYLTVVAYITSKEDRLSSDAAVVFEDYLQINGIRDSGLHFGKNPEFLIGILKLLTVDMNEDTRNDIYKDLIHDWYLYLTRK